MPSRSIWQFMDIIKPTFMAFSETSIEEQSLGEWNHVAPSIEVLSFTPREALSNMYEPSYAQSFPFFKWCRILLRSLAEAYKIFVITWRSPMPTRKAFWFSQTDGIGFHVNFMVNIRLTLWTLEPDVKLRIFSELISSARRARVQFPHQTLNWHY